MPRSGCFVFPGQGSQSIGMLKTFDKDEIEFLEQSFKRLFDFDLLSIIQNGPSESLNTTSITQPAANLPPLPSSSHGRDPQIH